MAQLLKKIKIGQDGSGINPTTGLGNKNLIIASILKFVASIDLPSLATQVSAVQAFTVTGVKVGDIVLAYHYPTDLTVGYVIGSVRVTAADQVKMELTNNSAGTIDPAAQNFVFIIMREA